MWLAPGRGSWGPKTGATSGACSNPSSSAASQCGVAGVASWVMKATWSPEASSHQQVARAAVRELVLRDRVHDRAVPPSDLLRSVRGAGIDDDDLEFPIDLLPANRGQHLVEVARSVQHGDRNGDDAGHQRLRRRASPMRTNALIRLYLPTTFHQVEPWIVFNSLP